MFYEILNVIEIHKVHTLILFNRSEILSNTTSFKFNGKIKLQYLRYLLRIKDG